MFSVQNRDETVEKLQTEIFDILVIGGGITGVGIALDAVGRGLSVALIEKQDFAAGTSSRSTKLIHGGLRYLKQLEFGIVREVGHERKTVYHNAPHLVIPQKMLLPITENGSMGEYAASLGIYVYDWLAGVQRKERRLMLNQSEALNREPLLKPEELRAGVVYWEYRSDDARLVIEVAKTASADGALLLNYCEFDDFLYEEKKVSGVRATDLHQNTKLEIKAREIINAAGPWVDEVRKKDEKVKGKRLHLTKGVHLVFDHKKLPLRQSVYFDVSDGRMVFAIPRDGCTYVGTTDTDYKGSLERPSVSKADMEYLLKAVNSAFNIKALRKSDIRSSWSGLRPLIHEDGKSPSELSRKDEIFISKNGVISIAGGKLTGYRKMAERTVNLAMEKLHKKTGKKKVSSRTSGKKLSGGRIHSVKAFLSEVGESEFDETVLSELFHKYGSNSFAILDIVDTSTKDRTLALLLAELKYCAENEMIFELSDFLIRRTGRIYFHKAEVEKYASVLNRELAKFLGLTKEKEKKSLDTYLHESKDVLNFNK